MRQRGFTLLEVMISLAILAGGLVVLLSASAANVARTQRARTLAIATDLARGKMYDVEEQLLKEGFQELDQDEDGDFAEEGWERFSWETKIEKVELPGIATLGSLTGGEGEQSGEAGQSGGVLGGLLGMAGGTDPSQAAGASLIASQFELIANVLEESIRKVTVTVKYKVAGHDEKLIVNCYFTAPAAVNRVLGGAGGAPAGDAAGSPGTGGTGTGGTGTGGSGSSGSGSSGSSGGSVR